jgi:L-alanine-DL-glutamate epimerase-like enolase superfamily enzyme
VTLCSSRASLFYNITDRIKIGVQGVNLSVTTRIVNAQMRNWIFVRVDTDCDGLYGWGRRASR